MAKKSGFYKHEKRQKELAKQKKKREKAARKSRRATDGAADKAMDSDPEGGAGQPTPGDDS